MSQLKFHLLSFAKCREAGEVSGKFMLNMDPIGSARVIDRTAPFSLPPAVLEVLIHTVYVHFTTGPPCSGPPGGSTFTIIMDRLGSARAIDRTAPFALPSTVLIHAAYRRSTANLRLYSTRIILKAPVDNNSQPYSSDLTPDPTIQEASEQLQLADSLWKECMAEANISFLNTSGSSNLGLQLDFGRRSDSDAGSFVSSSRLCARHDGSGYLDGLSAERGDGREGRMSALQSSSFKLVKVVWEHACHVKATTRPATLGSPRCVRQLLRTRCRESTGLVMTSFSARTAGAILPTGTHVCVSVRCRLTLIAPRGSPQLRTGITALRVRTQAPCAAHAESASGRSALCNLRFIDRSAHSSRPIRGLPALHPPLLPTVAAYKLLPLRPFLRVHTRAPVLDGFTRLAAENAGGEGASGAFAPAYLPYALRSARGSTRTTTCRVYFAQFARSAA
ncbi:hypothetical protein C8R44DRAFT_744750 [Mycena epipterygia]|nr:hypothetical protein C8R44DRAFT_744750 [Mycena epipterygia]